MSDFGERSKVNLDLKNLFIDSLGQTYQVRLMTEASTFFFKKKSTFRKKIPFKCIRKQI